MTYKELNDRYRNVDDETLLNQIEHDFGKEAAEHLKRNGYLTLKEAMDYRYKLIEEAFGIPIINHRRNAHLIGWTYNEPTYIDFENVVLDFTKY